MVGTADMLEGRADIQRHHKRLQEGADGNPSQNSTRMGAEPGTWNEVSLAMLEAGRCLGGSAEGSRAQQEQFSTAVCYHAFNPNKSHIFSEHVIVCFLV